MTLTTLTLVTFLLLVGASPAAAQEMSTLDSARHALQRLGWGPRPGDVEAVAATGVIRWIEQQLQVRTVDDPGATGPFRDAVAFNRATPDLVAEYTDRIRNAATARPDSMAMSRRSPPSQSNRRGDLRRHAGELMAVTLYRQARSGHQLAEVLSDFWSNHFNVFLNKGLDRVLLRDHLEHSIRAHALGRFEDLLLATARSPAMLFYLDNAQSVVSRGNRGLNENYARELLELHTLGVDGGYEQTDVREVARILTGWGIERRDGAFAFRPNAHDRNEKTVLGVKYPRGGGQEEGERLIRWLANHPATMHHISAKLCTRLVADVPPDGCIDAAVRAWSITRGDIRAVVRAIVMSPDFWSPVHVGSKLKSPHEFVVSAVRALGGVPELAPALAQQVAALGQPLFQQSAPTGWPETQDEWVNSGALLARMTLAVQLATGRVPGVAIDLERVVPLTDDGDELVRRVDVALLEGSMSARTRETIRREIDTLPDAHARRAMAVGLALGSPEFQRQ